MKSIDPTQLARFIDVYCVAHDVSKAEFSQRTGISVATLSQWRKGIYKPSEKNLAAIAEFVDMSAEELSSTIDFAAGISSAPVITDDTVSFPVIGGVAAGYDHICYEDWTGDCIEIPRSYLRGREPKEHFVLRVQGQSMYPDYQDGDYVLVLCQSTMDRSGQVGVVIYGDENATLKRVEYVNGENWIKLCPVNPQYPPITVRDEALEHCTVLGIAKMVIREVGR